MRLFQSFMGCLNAHRGLRQGWVHSFLCPQVFLYASCFSLLKPCVAWVTGIRYFYGLRDFLNSLSPIWSLPRFICPSAFLFSFARASSPLLPSTAMNLALFMKNERFPRSAAEQYVIYSLRRNLSYGRFSLADSFGVIFLALFGSTIISLELWRSKAEEIFRTKSITETVGSCGYCLFFTESMAGRCTLELRWGAIRTKFVRLCRRPLLL